MSVESVKKITTICQQFTKEEESINNKVAELHTLEVAIIDSVRKEFAARREKIHSKYVAKCLYNINVVRECTDFLGKLQKGKYIAVSEIPEWMDQIVGDDEKKEIEVPSAFTGIWPVEEFQQIREYFSKLIATAKHCKATSRAEGRKSGYKGRDTELAMGELWENIELISKNAEIGKVEWFNECKWESCFDSACENIPSSKWDWGDHDSEYVKAEVTVPAIVFHAEVDKK